LKWVPAAKHRALAGVGEVGLRALDDLQAWFVLRPGDPERAPARLAGVGYHAAHAQRPVEPHAEPIRGRRAPGRRASDRARASARPASVAVGSPASSRRRTSWMPSRASTRRPPGRGPSVR